MRQPDGRWAEDFPRAAPQLVPVLSLGRRMDATRAAHGSLTFAVAGAGAGGAALREFALSADMFRKGEASGLQVDLMDMKVPQLKDELEARGETKTGCKPWLRGRLHAAIVRAHIAAAATTRRMRWGLVGAGGDARPRGGGTAVALFRGHKRFLLSHFVF